MKLKNTAGFTIIHQWLAQKEFIPFSFQEETWQHIVDRKSGLVNAPTGCGKTFSVFLGAVINFINENPENYQTKNKNGLQLLWITPLRALAKDIGRAMEEVIAELGMNWQVGIRNGDTTIAERAKQKRNVPEVLIITPESLHLLLAQKNYLDIFKTLQIIAVDEWHELLGSKRGVQVELALSRIINLKNNRSKQTKKQNFSYTLSVWGISATIGNLEQAREVLLSPLSQIGLQEKDFVTVTAKIDKPIKVESIFPDKIENYPWAGHLGIKLVDKVIPIILESRTTLIFINTRGMSEMWYQALLRACPDLAGAIALHHGSIDQALRFWVEENLHTGNLKAVVCTASLDLGVDFRPVETVIQVGSPKGVARFLQRAGRSGHRSGEVSKIYFLPTHSLELVEAAALKDSIDINLIENREPRILCYDVLIQYLSTLAISDGFYPENVLNQIRSTYCYREITDDEWQQILRFVTAGGVALQQYDDYKKMEVIDGLYKITSRRIAMRHRMHIGTFVSDPMLKVKLLGGGYVGVIEEWFVARMQPGDVFTLSGRTLEFVMIKDMTCIVRKSSAKKSMIPSWQGGRMPL
ncbi:MAG TPA: DEAD/DEAH box helicase, partial [Hanamia sp.]|nr:DEAD/DEAH box helicase [Hanamia sp.]